MKLTTRIERGSERLHGAWSRSLWLRNSEQTRLVGVAVKDKPHLWVAWYYHGQSGENRWLGARTLRTLVSAIQKAYES